MTAPTTDSTAPSPDNNLNRPIYSGRDDVGIDSKWRLTIPAKHRSNLIKDKKVYVAGDPQQSSLMIFSANEYEAFMRPLLDLSAAVDPVTGFWKEWFTTNAEEQVPDDNGRLVLPHSLRDHAALRADSKAVFVGMGYRCQLWDLEKYEAHRAEVVQRMRNSPVPNLGAFKL